MWNYSNDTPASKITLQAHARARAPVERTTIPGSWTRPAFWRGFWAQFAGLEAAALGVLCFSLTVPATRAAVPEMGALFVGAARSVLAGSLALAVLLARREQFPRRSDLIPLMLVSLGVVFGFPVCSAMALRSVPAVHALVIVGLVPIATALLAARRSGERPGTKFWLTSLVGAAAVLGFGLSQSSLYPMTADVWMLLAVFSAAFGYGEGARLTRRLGGWRVISWALVLSLPFSLGLSWVALEWRPVSAVPSWRALVGFGYLGVVSMYLGFFAWYRGLTRTTIARASQVQLAQPVLGMFWSWLLLEETVTGPMLLSASFVLACAAWASRQRAANERPRTFRGGLARAPGALTPRA